MDCTCEMSPLSDRSVELSSVVMASGLMFESLRLCQHETSQFRIVDVPQLPGSAEKPRVSLQFIRPNMRVKNETEEPSPLRKPGYWGWYYIS